MLCRDSDHSGHSHKVEQLTRGTVTRFGMIAEMRHHDKEYADAQGGVIAKECGKCSDDCSHMWTGKSQRCCSLETNPDEMDDDENFYCSVWVTTSCRPKPQKCVEPTTRPAIPPEIDYRVRISHHEIASGKPGRAATQWPTKPTMYVLSGSQQRWNNFEKPQWAKVVRVVAPTVATREWFCLPWMIDTTRKTRWTAGTMNVATGHVQIWQRVLVECKAWCLVSEDDITWPETWNMPALPKTGKWSSMSMDTRGMLDECRGELAPSDPNFQRMARFECQIGKSKFNRVYDRDGQLMYRRDTGFLYGTGAYAMTADAAVSWIKALPFRAPVDHHMWKVAVENGTGLVPRFFETQHWGRSSIKVSRDFELDRKTHDGKPKLAKGTQLDSLGMGKYG